VHEHEGRTVTTLQERGRDAGDVEPPVRHGETLDQPGGEPIGVACDLFVACH
jgi:hypothetical protein